MVEMTCARTRALSAALYPSEPPRQRSDGLRFTSRSPHQVDPTRFFDIYGLELLGSRALDPHQSRTLVLSNLAVTVRCDRA